VKKHGAQDDPQEPVTGEEKMVAKCSKIGKQLALRWKNMGTGKGKRKPEHSSSRNTEGNDGWSERGL